MAFGERTKPEYFMEIIMKDVYIYGHYECKYRTVKMVYDKSNSFIVSATQRSPCECERTLTPENTADEFLLIRTNSEGDIVLGYETIQEPDFQTCMEPDVNSANYCYWIDQVGYHSDRDDSLHIGM